MSQPKIKEVRAHFGGDGRIAIKDFGRISSGYSANITRAYEIPDDWTEDQVAEFELQTILEIKAQIEPILQAEYDERYEIRDWEHERGPRA